MLKREDFLVQARVETVVLEAWVAAGWVKPERRDEGEHFSEADLARARLIADLKHDLGVNDEGIGVILDLLDQMHGLRRTLRELVRALQSGPGALREELRAAVLGGPPQGA